MAEIFLAALHRDEGFEKRVVLKRILPQFSADPSFVQMFIDEAVVAARISHPNIVQVYDFGNVDGTYFIAMEYVDGVDLRRVLASDGRLTGAQVAAIGEGVARALAHAHNLADDDGLPLNIVHRDVSPHNIMISRAGEAKLMDFGIAKAEARVSKTATGTIKGKIAYMAPEQGAGQLVDKRSDQFALGLVLWECVAGERMFAGDSDLAVLQQVVRCEVRDLCAVEPEVPPALAQVIMRCLAAQPEARYADLLEAADALAAFRYSLGAEGAVQLGEFVPAAPVPEMGSGRRTRVLPEEPADAGRRTRALPEEPADTVRRPRGQDPVATPRADWQEGGATAATMSTPAVPGEAEASVPLPVGAEVSASGSYRDPLPSGISPASSTRRRWLTLVAGLVALAIGALVWQRLGSTPVDATVARVEVISAPSGARVLLEGLDTGLHTPAILPAQQRGQPLRLDLLLEGYERWHTQVTPSGAVERVAATLLQAEAMPPRVEVGAGEVAGAVAPRAEVAAGEATGAEVAAGEATGAEVAAGTLAPTSASDATDDTVVDTAVTDRRAKKKRRRARSEATGQLSLRSTGAWVDVFLRGRKLGTTPLKSVEVPAGKLRLRLVNSDAGIDQELEVHVHPDAELRRTVTPRP